MRIGIQGQYDLYTGFNAREAVSRIPMAAPENSDALVKSVDESAANTSDTRNESAAGNRNGDVGEIADRLRTGTGFSSVDKAARISDYEVQKAYSDLEKDESLKQYQYFVGEGEIIDDSEDGIVIRKSGFDLF